jgi:hypothetical protein
MTQTYNTSVFAYTPGKGSRGPIARHRALELSRNQARRQYKVWKKEAQSGMPALGPGESYLIVIMEYPSGRIMRAWSPSAGGEIPTASLQQVRSLLPGAPQPSELSAEQTANENPLLTQVLVGGILLMMATLIGTRAGSGARQTSVSGLGRARGKRSRTRRKRKKSGRK